MSTNKGKSPELEQWHINQKGIPAKCHAKKRSCPLGGMRLHKQTLEEIRELADEINARVSKLKGISFEEIEGRVFLSQTTRIGLANCNNLDYNISTLEAVSSRIREKIAFNLKKQGIKSLNWNNLNLSYMEEQEVEVFDTEKFEAYFKESSKRTKATYMEEDVVEEYVEVVHGGSPKMNKKLSILDDMHSELIANAHNSARCSFRVRTNAKGQKYVTLDSETLSTLHNLRQIEEKIAEAKILQSAFKERLSNAMKEQGVDNIEYDGIRAKLHAQRTVMRPNLHKIRKNGLFKYMNKKQKRKEHIRIRDKDPMQALTNKPNTKFMEA